MNLLDALNWRYAVREFADTTLDEEVVSELVEATRLSPSAYGLQPYKLIVIHSDSIKTKLLDYAMGQSKVKHCSHLLVFAVNTTINEQFIAQHFAYFERERSLENGALAGYQQHVKEVMLPLTTEQLQQWAENQAYIALGNLLTSAAIRRVDTCPMAGFEKQGFDKVLGLAKHGLKSTVICALGERAESDVSAAERKVRLSIDSFSMEL